MVLIAIVYRYCFQILSHSPHHLRWRFKKKIPRTIHSSFLSTTFELTMKICWIPHKVATHSFDTSCSFLTSPQRLTLVTSFIVATYKFVRMARRVFFRPGSCSLLGLDPRNFKLGYIDFRASTNVAKSDNLGKVGRKV